MNKTPTARDTQASLLITEPIGAALAQIKVSK